MPLHTFASRLALCATLALLAPRSSAAQESQFDGEWIGGFRAQDRWVFVKARFGGTDRTLAGRVDIPTIGDRGVLLRNVSADRDHLSFSLPGRSGDVVFDGRLRADRVKGEVRQGPARSEFELMRIRPDGVPFKTFAGTYAFADGEMLLLFAGPGGPTYIDYATGRMGVLFAIDDTTFVSGPSILAGYPVELTVRFDRDAAGRATGLSWERTGEPGRRATRQAFFRTEDVAYESGDVHIGGTLLVPLGRGPFPAVVMIHGSGPATRASLLPFAASFARHGVAVLVPDKRGVGASTGDWVRATFDDLSADAVAGVDWLTTRQDIDPRRIGLHGQSLGGWVAPLAASRSARVSFVIVEAAPSVSPAEHERWRVEQQMRADGVHPALMSRALAFMDRKAEVGRSGEGWDGLEREAQQARREGWAACISIPRARSRACAGTGST